MGNSRMTTLEKVARAIDPDAWKLEDDYCRKYRVGLAMQEARAAIKALMEPLKAQMLQRRGPTAEVEMGSALQAILDEERETV